MENLGVNLAGAYRGRRILITGHTGFKGSWLALMLDALGAQVTGLSFDIPSKPSHWELLKLNLPDHRIDICDEKKLRNTVKKTEPEIVFHLAAQSLVRRSYREALLTWQTNVIGTANVLETCRELPSLKAVVIATTDKCYENKESATPYKETDALGGHDPYSASKAAAELVIASYRKAFFSERNSPLVASVRAGNVIGGGDWSEDRLIPDLVRALDKKEKLIIRSPNATRPWQHALDLLTGYLQLGEKLLMGKKEYAEAWNFGPDQSGNCTVNEVLQKLCTHWSKLNWQVTHTPQPHEATLLALDSTKARTKLGWRPRWTLDEGLQATATWYQRYYDTGETISRKQCNDYMAAL